MKFITNYMSLASSRAGNALARDRKQEMQRNRRTSLVLVGRPEHGRSLNRIVIGLPSTMMAARRCDVSRRTLFRSSMRFDAPRDCVIGGRPGFSIASSALTYSSDHVVHHCGPFSLGRCLGAGYAMFDRYVVGRDDPW